MNKHLTAAACGALALACGQVALGVNYDTRYSASTGVSPSPSGAWPNYAISGEPEIAVVGTGDTAFLQCIDNNLRESGTTEPGYRENIGMYATRNPEINENWWFESDIRVHSADAGLFRIGADVIDQGQGNHGFVQFWWYAGADGVVGGTGADQDQVVVTTLDDASPTTLAQNLITVDADFSTFHRYALQRDYAAGQIQLFVDGKNVGNRPLADFSDYPPPAYGDGANYQDLPGTGVVGQASYDFRRHDLSLGQGVRRAWNTTGGGDWSNAANWFAAIPDATNAVVDLGRAITGAASINLDSARSVGAIAFDSPLGYTIGGTGTLTFDGTTNTNPQSRIDSYTGQHTISAPVSLNSTIAITVIGGSTLTIDSQMTVINPLGARVTKFGDGLLQIKNVRASEIEVNNGTVRILPDGTTNGLSGVNLIAIGGVTDAWTGKLDLENNSIIADYATGDPSPIDTIANYIKNGYAGGAWNGNGMTSSAAATSNPKTALGYGEASVVYPSGGSFMTVPVDADMVLVKYTYSGDANLDGQVDISDLGALATSWQTSAMWTGGDFDYSGFVDISDLGILATNWQVGVGAPLGPSFDEALASVGLAGVSVPEPTMMGLALLGAWSLKRPRRAIPIRKSQVANS